MNSKLDKLGVASAMAKRELQTAADAWAQFRIKHGEAGVESAATPGTVGHSLFTAKEAARQKCAKAAAKLADAKLDDVFRAA